MRAVPAMYLIAAMRGVFATHLIVVASGDLLIYRSVTGTTARLILDAPSDTILFNP